MTNQEFAGVPFLSKPRGLLPIGSPERDVATLRYLKIRWESYVSDIKSWGETLSELEAERIWERYPPGKPYGSKDKLLKEEIGYTVDESISEIERRILLKEHSQRKLGKVGAPEGNKNASHNKEENKDADLHNCKPSPKRYKSSLNPDYLLDRIERDFPETYQDVKDGKFRSTRQAAISVGIVKKDDRWTAPGPVEKLALAIVRRYTTQQIQQLKELL